MSKSKDMPERLDLPLVEIKVPQKVRSCHDCFMSKTSFTPNAGHALDYYCTAVKPARKALHYIEYGIDLKTIPKWCPGNV